MRPMETSTRPWITSMFGLFLLAACASETTNVDSSTTALSGGTETGEGDGDGDTSEPFVPVPARGDIALTQVVVNQGVDVPISNDGVWVDGTERNTYVLSNRDSLLRAYWTIPEDWLARPITARLELHYPDGTDVVREDTKMIAGPSFAGDLDRGFWFALLAEEFPPGLEYHISLWEAAPGAEEERESTTITESPIGGRQLIGVQQEPAELHVVMMPVAYNNGDCNTNTGTEVSEAQEQLFLDYLHEQYPVQEVFLDFRRDTPIVWEQNLNSLAELWAPLQDQRTADNAPPNWYYYALVNACAGGIDGAGGIAPGLAPDTKAAAFERVSSGLWLPESNDYSYHTMVHELGHNHGRAHVFCAGGDAAGVDPAYPHEDGVIGVWGFGIRLFELHSPTANRDFMTYCSPNWVSDWGWTKAYNRIRTLTSWDYEGAPASDEPQGEVLIGLLLKDGSERWWTTPGGREPEHYSSGEFISFDYRDGETIASPTSVQILDDGNTMITAPVPRPAVAFASATRIDRGQARTIELRKR